MGASTAVERRPRRPLRDVNGAASAEAALIVAICTILVTRAYLAATGYPQLGTATVHIAHAVWGAAGMMVGLMLGWMFLGHRVRVISVVIGGIGFGLFLDEIGKFVTKSNDYFFQPAAAIMYTAILVLLVINRAIRDFRQPSREECLANAASIAADGVALGLGAHYRATAERALTRAEELGANAESVAAIRTLLAQSQDRPEHLRALGAQLVEMVPGLVRSPRWVPVLGGVMVAIALYLAGKGIIQLSAWGFLPGHSDRTLFVGPMGIGDGILFASALITLALAVPALLDRNRSELSRLRSLRMAALVSTALTALVEFADQVRVALYVVAFGLFMLAVLSYRIRAGIEAGGDALEPAGPQPPAAPAPAAPVVLQSKDPAATPTLRQLVRRVRFTLLLTGTIVVIGLATGALWTPVTRFPWFNDVAIGWPALREGRWWTVVSSWFFGLTPGQYITITAVFVVVVGWCEIRLGTKRIALICALAQISGVVGASLIAAGLDAAGLPWGHDLAQVRDVGCTTAMIGAVAATSATLRSPWRLRLRAILVAYVVIGLLFEGKFADITHAVALVMCLVIGERYFSTAERGWRPRTRREVRTIAFVGLLVMAAVYIVIVVAPGRGPLGPTAGARDTLLDTVVNVVVIALVANQLRQGRRWAWWATIIFGWLSIGAAVIALYLAIVEGADDGNGAITFGTGLLWAGIVALLTTGRQAFQVPVRRRLRSGALAGNTPPEAARELLRQYGSGTMSWMTTWADNSYYFGTAGDRYVAFQRHAGVVIALADPVAPPGQIAATVADFVSDSEANGLVPCLFSVSAAVADDARAQGLRTVQIAEDTLIDLENLEFTGKAWQDVRSAMNRANREGIDFILTTLADQPFNVVAQVRAISDAWVGDKGIPEMGFTLGGVEEAMDPEVRVGLAIDSTGNVHGVTSWLPVYGAGAVVQGWTLDVMRRRHDGFRPVIEYLIASACMAFKDEGMQFVSLSGAPLARSGDGPLEPLSKALNVLGGALEPLYGFRSLHAFKEKFQPRHEPVYMCFRDESDLPRIGMALTRAYLPDASTTDLARLTMAGK